MGGSSKSVTVGYRYYVGMHMVLCRGPIDFVTEIKVDDKALIAGSITPGSYFINREDLFGGEGREGGVSGALDVMGGEASQGFNSYLASKLGSFVPAFRGVVSVVLRQMYLGINPYLKKWSFTAQRIHKRQAGIEQWYGAKAAISGQRIDGVRDYFLYDDLALEGNIYIGPPNVPGTYVEISGFLTTDVISISVPGGRTHAAWSRWAEDSQNGGKSWLNGFSITTPNNVTTDYYQTYFATAAEAAAWAAAQTPIQLTGFTSYKIHLNDYIVKMNRGGISLKITVSGSYLWQDMNPAHIIRECLTDPDWGMGYAESDMDDVAFTSAANVLYDESMGISLLWDTQISIEEFIQLICKHINATIYVERTTGKFVLKLIRQDYDENALLELNPSNVSQVQDFTRVSFGELVNSITVSYWNAAVRDTSTVTVTDIALASTQGATINTSVKYDGFTSPDIASRVAQRDLKALSTPLISCTIYANTDAADLNIGDCFKLSWPDYDIDEVIMRVATIGYGDGKSNRVRLTCTQDVFAMPDIAYIAPTPPEGVPTNNPPVPVEERLAFEVPYLEAVQQMGQSVVDSNLATNSDIAYFAIAAGRPSSNSLNARLYTNAGAGYQEQSTVDFCPFAKLSANIDRNSVSFAVEDLNDQSQIQLGSWFQIGSEIMEVVTLLSGTIEVKRGLLDTVPVEHSAGDTLFFWDVYAGEDSTQYVSGETVSGKLSTFTGSGVLPISSAPSDSVEMAGRLFKPYPPGKFQINGEYFPEIIGLGDVAFTWAHRDRRQQTGADYAGFLENSIGPEIGTSYNVRIYSEFDLLIHTESAISGTSYTYTNDQELLDAGASIVQNPFWNDTVFLSNFNGSNGSTTFTDLKGHAQNAVGGNAQITTTSPKYGSGCLILDGSGDFVNYPDSNDWDFGTGDFTVECWINFTSISSNQTIVGNYVNSSLGFSFQRRSDSSSLSFAWGDTFLKQASWTPTLGTWYHIAVCRKAGNIRLFINGVSQGSAIANSTNLSGSTSDLTIGALFVSGSYRQYTNAKIDDLRITKAGHYDADFSPPSVELGEYVIGGARLNGKLRIELESERDSVTSFQVHNVTIRRIGYGFNYGEYYGGES